MRVIVIAFRNPVLDERLGPMERAVLALALRELSTDAPRPFKLLLIARLALRAPRGRERGRFGNASRARRRLVELGYLERVSETEFRLVA